MTLRSRPAASSQAGPRALHSLRGDVNALKLALLLLFLNPGAPCIYYGTEAGLCGGPEPACREAFPWDAPWSVDLRPFIQELARLRKRHPLLRKSGLRWSSEGADGLRGEDLSPEVLWGPEAAFVVQLFDDRVNLFSVGEGGPTT